MGFGVDSERLALECIDHTYPCAFENTETDLACVSEREQKPRGLNTSSGKGTQVSHNG
jgi:hypothetical protein